QGVTHVEDDRVAVSLVGEDGYEPAMCVRRVVLDVLLHDAAVAAGAISWTGTRVTGLIEHDGRVRGVLTDGGGGAPERMEAPLVVGADGMNSTIGRLVGARRYHVLENRRFFAYAYYEDVPVASPAAVTLLRQDDKVGFACPTDSGLFLVTLSPE